MFYYGRYSYSIYGYSKQSKCDNDKFLMSLSVPLQNLSRITGW
jgi:hypothetical protein